MDAVLDGLNAAQRAAVVSPVDVLQVLAPPGSGKTKTLTSRVAYLLRHSGYKAYDIICLTFTIKSSTEMKERISKLIGLDVSRRLILGTFHSVCRRYLVAYGYLIGISKDFGIADSSDQISIIKRIHKRLGLTIDPKVAQSRISKSKSKGLGYHDLAYELTKKTDVEQQEIVKLFEAYEAHLAASNLLDYDDLLLKCVYLLRTHPSCVSNVEVVLVDEFQDTNVVQFDLLRLFAAHKNRITTVGDPDQSIYGWRSAEIRNLEKMQKQYPDTLVIRLEDNYRSSGAILLAAQEVIEQDESRPQKSILPTHSPGTVPVLRKLPSANIEAEWTVTEIQRTMALTGHLLEFSDFAILLRSAALSRLLESAMGRAGIPYRMIGGQRFFDRVEIRILLDYLRVISQPSNNDALVRIINTPARGIGTPTIKALLEEAETRKQTLWALVQTIVKGHKSAKTKTSKVAEQGLSTLSSIVITTRSMMLDLSNPQNPERLLSLVIRKLNFQNYLEKSHPEDHESRWANVEELIVQACEYRVPLLEKYSESEADDYLPQIDSLEQEKGCSAEEALSKFLANVALAAAADVMKDDVGDGNALSRVTISTIHAAKGLEWPVVFVPSAYGGIIPHSRAEDTDEERRLLYVAMTRAQALLYMSLPLQNSQREDTNLSPFLSTKNVTRLLTNQGPVINVPVVVDIARILRRKCPSRGRIEEDSQGLRSNYDNLWALTGEKSIDAVQKQWSKWEDSTIANGEKQTINRGSESRQLSDRSGSGVISKTTTIIGNTTTMDNAAAFSYHGSAGFSSASAQLRLARESKGSIQETTPRERGSSAGAERPRKRLKEDSNSLKLWGRRENAPTILRDGPALPKADRETVLELPTATIPTELASHSLNTVIKRPAPREYVLLSSSPPPSEKQMEEADKNTRSTSDQAALIPEPQHVFQTKSISQLQSGFNINRKTLGVRRNMAGWPTHHSSHSFKVPAKTSKHI